MSKPMSHFSIPTTWLEVLLGRTVSPDSILTISADALSSLPQASGGARRHKSAAVVHASGARSQPVGRPSGAGGGDLDEMLVAVDEVLGARGTPPAEPAAGSAMQVRPALVLPLLCFQRVRGSVIACSSLAAPPER